MNKKREVDVELILTQSETQDNVIIPRKDVHNAPERLGVQVAADGSWSKEYSRWTRTAVEFSQKVRKEKFSRVCGWKVFSEIWCAKIRFVAGVFGLDKAQLDELQKTSSSRMP